MHSFAWWPTFVVLVVATFTDLRSRRIPNWLVLPFMLAGLVVPAWLSGWHGFWQSLEGFGLGALVYGILSWIGGMGMGDVKFLAAMCSFLGMMSITWILPLSSLIGSVLGLTLIFWQRGAWGTRIPYGPFLGLAAILWLFGGSDFMNNYWHHVYVSWSMWNPNAPMIDEKMINPGR